MATPRFLDVFSDCISESLKVCLENALLIKCNLDIEERKLDIELSSEKYITNENQININLALKSALKLSVCNIVFSFSQEALCIESCCDVAEELKIKNPAVNGYLSGAEYELAADRVVITLKHGGYEKILECGFVNNFKIVVENRFGKKLDVEFIGQLDDVEMELPPIEIQKPIERKAEKKPDVAVNKISFEKRQEKPQNGIVYLDNPKQFYGRRFDASDVKPMISVSPEDNEICCWGQVFGKEVRTINTKRGESNILSFSFSDYTNSINCSMFVDPKKMDTVAEVKDGNFLLIRGFYEFDNYKKDFILKPNAMAVLQSYSETDDYDGEKRIELHCHTNMSEKDAVCSAESIIEQAFKWGHKAVAITDHGVVQAYPAAAGAVKKIRKGGGDFKLIYGMEGYFVDDVTESISDLNSRQIKRYHQIILVKDLVGLKNVLINLGIKPNTKYFWKKVFTRSIG